MTPCFVEWRWLRRSLFPYRQTFRPERPAASVEHADDASSLDDEVDVVVGLDALELDVIRWRQANERLRLAAVEDVGRAGILRALLLVGLLGELLLLRASAHFFNARSVVLLRLLRRATANLQINFSFRHPFRGSSLPTDVRQTQTPLDSRRANATRSKRVEVVAKVKFEDYV